MSDEYSKRGASSDKKDVHEAIQNINKGLFPQAFCKILPDSDGDDLFCQLIHADGAGTKSSLAYIYWRETGDLSVWKGIAQDAVVMNTDDLICVGATNRLLLSSTIGRNKRFIPGDVIRTLIEGTEEFIANLEKHGIQIQSGGGETADVGDLVKTVIVDSTITARMAREDVIDNARIQPGDVIIGLSSFGKTTYESIYTGGIGSNGLTLARHELFLNRYAELYPESFDNHLSSDLVYQGTHQLTDPIPKLSMTVGQLCLSPTRTYLPVMHVLLKEYRKAIHGLVHCTGGGQTKVLHSMSPLHVLKTNLYEPPLIFKLIQQNSSISWKEMYQVFNMGHRLELYVSEKTAEELLPLITTFNLDARIIGRVEKSTIKKVTIQSSYGEFVYQ